MSTSNSKHRLVLNYIDVVNFKSYHGTHRIGPLHKHFTAVIGPNGSGKSNVIDALLFVFGKNARKIRHDRLAGVIHSSAAHPDVTFASVTAHFVAIDETHEQTSPTSFTEVPESAISLRREVFKTGSTQYSINGEKVTAKEVIRVLLEKGIDLNHNRFLILQGEVEQIAMMKPRGEKEGDEGLLEYLDDLIGTNRFVSSIAEATKRLDVAQTLRLETLDTRRKVEAERLDLEEAKNQTVAFISKDNHLQQLLIIVSQQRMARVEELLEPFQGRLRKHDSIIEGLKKEGDELQLKKQHLLATDKEYKAQLREKRDACNATREKYDKAAVDVERAAATVDEAEKQRKRDTEREKRHAHELAKLKQQLADVEREVSSAERAIASAQDELRIWGPQHESLGVQLKEKLAPLRRQLEEKKAEAAPYSEEVSAAEEALRTLRDEQQAMETNLNSREVAVEKMRQDIVSRQKRLDDIDEILSQSASINSKFSSLEGSLAEVLRKRRAAEAELESMRRDERHGSSEDNVLTFLLRQRIDGYFGTLRQLCSADPSLDVAIGAASGAWGYHVVEDSSTATVVSALLKKNDMRATMIVLREVQSQHGESLTKAFTAPSGSSRLFDKVKAVNEKFSAAVYFALRDTVVVDSLTTARRITGARVVTMGGELVEADGTITGGGQPRPANLRAAHSKANTAAIQKERDDLQAHVEGLLLEERRIQREVDAARATQRLGAAETKALRTEGATLSADMSNLQHRVEASSAQLAQDRKGWAQRKRNYQINIDAAEERWNKAHKASMKMEAEVSRIEAQIVTSGGSEFQRLGDSIKTAREAIAKHEPVCRDGAAKMRKLRASIEAKINGRGATATETDDDSAAAILKDHQRRCDEVRATLEAAESAMKALEDQLLSVQQRLSEVNKKIGDIDKRSDEEMEKRNEVVREMRPQQEQFEKFQVKVQSCIDKVQTNVREFGVETLTLIDAADIGERSAATSGKREREGGDPPKRSSGDSDDVPDVDEYLKSISLRRSPEELKRFESDRCLSMARLLDEEVRNLRQSISFESVAQWRTKVQQCREANTAYRSALNEATSAENALDEIKETRKEKFMDSFNRIRHVLRHVYGKLAPGGDADMELEDTNDPFEGVRFTVRPPRKTWKIISHLSGGEKTLSSLALIFALHHVQPTPLYVMDEIDAALDFRNVSIVAQYVLQQSTGNVLDSSTEEAVGFPIGAQFLIISLRNAMFERAHQLVGICKRRDVSQCLVMNPLRFHTKLRAVVEAALAERPAKRDREDGGALQKTTGFMRNTPRRPLGQLTGRAAGTGSS